MTALSTLAYDCLTSSTSRLAGLALGLSLLATGASAVMPPEAEARAAQGRLTAAAQQRAQSTDVLRIAVTDVTRLATEGEGCPTTERWEVRATVQEVLKGALKSGMPIVMRYERAAWRCPGPVREELPVLTVGQLLDAYLYCEGMRCVPAANALSFMPEEAFQAEATRRAEELRRLVAPVPVPRPEAPPQDLEEIRELRFEKDSQRLTPDSLQRLERHAQALRTQADLTVRVTGHVSHRHSAEAGLALSAQRAEAVKAALVRLGVPAGRVITVAGGRTDPKASPPACSHGGACALLSYP